MSTFGIVLLLVSVGTTLAYPEFRKVRVYHNGMYADEDVMVDDAEGYALVTVSYINGTGIPTINLHDARAGYSALKDVIHGKCHIHKSTHTIEDMKTRINQIVHNGGSENISQIFTVVSHRPIPSNNLSVYGDKIASFCQNYEPIFVVRKQELTRRDMMLLGSDDMADYATPMENRWCIICISVSQPTEEPNPPREETDPVV